MGQCEYHMEIGDIEQLCLSCPYPFLPFVTLALRAMAIAATVIADMHVTAI
jgi:hypothetical protein